MSFKLNGQVCSDLCIIKDFIQDILNKLEKIVSDETVMFDVKLILNELVANGVIHGNDFDKDKLVRLYLEVIEDTIRIEVTDEGEGFSYDLSTYNPLDLKCSGRGLIIVKGLSDEFYIDDNRIVSVKYF